MLEQTAQDILSREDMAGNISNISRDARMELSGALLQFIKCTKRFIYNWAMGQGRAEKVHQIHVIIIKFG